MVTPKQILAQRLRRRAAVLLLVIVSACATPSGEVPATLQPTTMTNPAPSSTVARPGTLWGFTPFPAAPDEEAVSAALDFVAEEGDLVAHHFDGSIPWSYLRGEEPLPLSLSAELEGRAAFDDAHPELTVYVATALTNLDRTGIPTDTGAASIPEVADSFADPGVRQALNDWVDLLVDTFEPTYLNVGVEIDMYAANRPDDWENLLSLYKEIYDRVKQAHPEMVVFASLQAELGDPAVFDQVMASSDVVGISTYPYLLSDAVPDADYLDRFTTAGLPIAITETGFPAADVASPRGTVVADPETQEEYVAWLGDRAVTPGLDFVVWFLPFDIDAFLGDPSTPDSALAFSHLGLTDGDGEARPSLARWRMNRSAGSE
jgi:hypothetical protein